MTWRKAGEQEIDVAWVVALVISEIDYSTPDRRELLLEDLLCAAWPSRAAQDQ